MQESPGIDPCPELATRGGIWRYSARKLHQRFSPAARYATGIRNADGITIDSTGHNVYSTQQGRDQLGQNWPKFFTPEQGAYLPSEEVMHVVRGGDFGWPYCYYDGVRQKLMLAPEYGGNGKKVGRCARMLDPVAAFPAHWAPDDLSFYYGKQFPSPYYGGVFVAFHGSWNRAPFPQQGYDVVFQPLAAGKASGNCEIFAEGFAGGAKDPGAAAHRPAGLAVGPDGALYVSDDVRGRIYRIVYRGGAGSGGGVTGVAACPDMTALGGGAGAANPLPPEGIHPAAGLPVPPGASRESVELGDRIFHGQVAEGTCAGCHGADGQGTPLGPNLTSGRWLWSKGSLSDIEQTILHGVPKPKEYRSPMPPMGGAQLTHEQVTAVAAYVWGLGHFQPLRGGSLTPGAVVAGAAQAGRRPWGVGFGSRKADRDREGRDGSDAVAFRRAGDHHCALAGVGVGERLGDCIDGSRRHPGGLEPRERIRAPQRREKRREGLLQ